MTDGRRFELKVLMLDGQAIPLLSGTAIEEAEDGISAWRIVAVGAGRIPDLRYARDVELIIEGAGTMAGRALVDVVAEEHRETTVSIRFVDPPTLKYRRLRALS